MTQPLGFGGRRPLHRFPNRVDAAMHRDWSINPAGGDILFVRLLRKDVGALVNFYPFFATTGRNATVQKTATEGLGASGMVIDNSSASAQASSVYFNALHEDAACSSPQTGANTGGCAVKLTQAGLR